jgi:hypothetical protein
MHDFWRSSGWHPCGRTAKDRLRPGGEPLRGRRRVAHLPDDPAVNLPLASRT